MLAGRFESFSGNPMPLAPQSRAAFTMLLAVAAFALMDAGLKHLAGHYPPMQVAALRGAASLPFILAWVAATGAFGTLWRVRWPLQVFRGLVSVAMIACFAYGLARMPMSTAYTIFFVAPLLITALSVPLLGEKVGPRRWTAILIGMVGVMVVMRPTGEGALSWAALAVALAATGYAVSAITVRVLARTDSTASMIVWLLVFLALGAGLLAWPDWVPIRSADLWVIGGLGLAGAIGQYALTEAFRMGEASLLAPLEYTGLLWSLMLDLMVWGVLPDSVTWIGAGIIVASGLYLLRRDRIVHAGDADPPPPPGTLG